MDARIEGRQNWALRAAIVAAAGVVIGALGLALPFIFDRLQTVCAVSTCDESILSPEGAQALHAFGVTPATYATLYVVVLVSFAMVHALVAALLIWRRSADRMALFAAVTLVTFGASTFPNTPLALVMAYPALRAPAGALALLGDAAIMVFLYVFPDGQFVPRWTRWLVLGWTLAWAPYHLFPGGPWDLGLLPPALRELAFAIGPVPAIFAQIYRYRHASSLEQRLQTKWVVSAVTLGLGAVFAVSVVGGASPEWASNPLVKLLLVAVSSLFMLAIPLSIGLAVLRYRLWDVDPLINRTLVWGSLALLITVAYVGVVVGIGDAIGTAGEPNLALSLLATALVALVFQPLRERLQRLANRLVYGQRASPYEVLADFSRRVAEALSVDSVLPRMAEAAASGVAASRSRVRVYVPNGRDQAVAWPPDAIAESFDRTVLVVHQGTPVGEISVAKAPGDPLTPTEAALLTDLASQAGMALSNVRLAVELEARLNQLAIQADELRASRQRIVTAQDAERRRLERDIHDGAQQHLLAIGINARLARQMANGNSSRTVALLDEIGVEVTDAIDNLRDLARGIFPSVLADHGLVAALRAHVAKGITAVQVEASPAVAAARFDPQIEAAVYFCCLEALQNAAKHAPGARVTVQLAEGDASLGFSVRDEGGGFDIAAVTHGTGLHSMADRTAALDGVLSIESTAGGPTTITGRVPLATTLASAQAPQEAVADDQAASSRSGPNSALDR